MVNGSRAVRREGTGEGFHVLLHRPALAFADHPCRVGTVDPLPAAQFAFDEHILARRFDGHGGAVNDAIDGALRGVEASGDGFVAHLEDGVSSALSLVESEVGRQGLALGLPFHDQTSLIDIGLDAWDEGVSGHPIEADIGIGVEVGGRQGNEPGQAGDRIGVTVDAGIGTGVGNGEHGAAGSDELDLIGTRRQAGEHIGAVDIG